MRPAALLVLLLAAACAGPRRGGPLASARVAPDFATYALRRVGLVPFQGEELAPEQAHALQSAFYSEFSARAGFEVVVLDAADLAEVPKSEGYRLGEYEPRTIIAVARRYRLDAVLVGTVTDLRVFAPQRLGLEVDLVASETGLAIWAASVYLDAAQGRTREGLERWSRKELGAEGDDWRVGLLSPSRFVGFAAYEMARLL